MLKSRVLVICLILVMVSGFIVAGATAVLAANTFSVNESSSGGNLLVGAGDAVEVVLNQQAVGCIWELVRNSDPSVLQSNGHVTQSASNPGGVGTDTWTFSALKAGASTIHMEYSQPWLGGDKNVRSFDLTVFVFDQLPTVPASSGWSVGLMAACVSAIMAFAIIRRTGRI